MNYYEILGVAKNATKDDIKRAFRKLTLKYHPDKNNNPQSSKFFILISEAYQTLSDDNKRVAYDYILTNHINVKKEQETKPNTNSSYTHQKDNKNYNHQKKDKKPINNWTIYKNLTCFFLLFCVVYYFIGLIISYNESESRKADLIFFRTIINYVAEPHKNKILLQKMKGMTYNYSPTDTSSNDNRNLSELLLGVTRYTKEEHKSEYLFLLAVLHYKASRKELALKYFEMAQQWYKKADWYYYVGISQAETQKDKTNACTNLKIAAERGDYRAKSALASYCQ